MNKKITSLIALPFLLASCHGASISREDALTILGHIEEINKAKELYNSYVFNIDINEENNVTQTRHYFNIEEKFYYYYSISNGNIEEKWRFVKDNDKEETRIYQVTRIIDSYINDETAPRYAYTSELYTDELWKSYNKSYMHILSQESFNLINALKSFLDEEPSEGNQVAFESSGQENLFVKQLIYNDEGRLVHDREISFVNCRLESYLYKADAPNRNRSYSVSYSKFEIYYPKFSE